MKVVVAERIGILNNVPHQAERGGGAQRETNEREPVK